MKARILKQMEAVVDDVMNRFQTDFFNYDKPQIEDADFKFPFIWIVGECHTHLLPLGKYRDMFFEAESVRYDYVREHNPYSHYCQSADYAEDHWFLVTESGLQSINQEQAKAAIIDYIAPAVRAWVEENGPLPKLTKPPVKFKDISLSVLKALIADCRDHDDDSLLECFKKRHRSRRVAADQYTVITYYKEWAEFGFCEYINGKASLAGGIVFHGWPEMGYNTNGSVQLTPRYGWSSHT